MYQLIATIVVAATQQLYQAQVPTYGCNSSENVTNLEKLRPTDEKTFQAQLAERVVQGDCVLFIRGSLVEGTDPDTAARLLHVQARLDPPGYISPLNDFKLNDGKEPAKP